MAVNIQFETDNAAFEDPAEASRILHEIAESIAGGSTGGGIRDINGNRIGAYRFETED